MNLNYHTVYAVPPSQGRGGVNTNKHVSGPPDFHVKVEASLYVPCPRTHQANLLACYPQPWCDSTGLLVWLDMGIEPQVYRLRSGRLRRRVRWSIWFPLSLAVTSISIYILTGNVKAVIFQTLPLPLPHLSLSLLLPAFPLPLTKNEKTTVDNFFHFCMSVVCLLHFIILRGRKPSFTAITLPALHELIVLNYSVFVFLRY